jgi:hypothetical protein
MQQIDNSMTHTYTMMLDALYEIVHTYLYRGRLAAALRIVQATQPMLDAEEVARRVPTNWGISRSLPTPCICLGKLTTLPLLRNY